MRLPPFFIALGCEEIPAPHLVIQTDSPYWIGKIIQFKTSDELASFKANSLYAEDFYQCRGYRIGVYIVDSFHVGMTHDITGFNMAEYFLNNKILPNHGYYKKYKIT